MGQACGRTTSPSAEPSPVNAGPLELSVVVIGPDAALRKHLLYRMRATNFSSSGNVEVTSSSNSEFTIKRFIVPIRGLSPKIDPDDAVLLHVREGAWSWSSDLSPVDAGSKAADCVCVVAPESTFMSNGHAFEYALHELASGMADGSRLDVFCVVGRQPADERSKELQPLLQRLSASLSTAVDAQCYGVHDLASDAGGGFTLAHKTALFAWLSRVIDLCGQGESALLTSYRRGDFVPVGKRTGQRAAALRVAYPSVTSAAEIKLKVQSSPAVAESIIAVHTWKKTSLSFITPAARVVARSDSASGTEVAVFTDVACAEVAQFAEVRFPSSPPPRLYVMTAGDERELFMLGRSPSGHTSGEWWVSAAWLHSQGGTDFAWRCGRVDEAAEVSDVTSLVAFGERPVALREQEASAGDEGVAMKLSAGDATDGDDQASAPLAQLRMWTTAKEESVNATQQISLSVTCDGTRTAVCAHAHGNTHSSELNVQDRSMAATGPLLAAPLLYNDAGLSSFAVIVRGSARSTQFLGLVAPGGHTRFVARELEPTARKILDGQYVAQ